MKKKKAQLFEGLPLLDATHDVKLHITPNDIKNSRKNDPANCAAARAGKRELKKDVRVFLTRTYVKHKKKWYRFITPESISREITSFDRGASFEPGEYKLKVPSSTQKLGIVRISGSGKSGKKNRIRKNHATAMVRTWKSRKWQPAK